MRILHLADLHLGKILQEQSFLEDQKYMLNKIIEKIKEEKRNKFMEYAGKRVNNVLHDMQILEPMARSNSYDFTKEDVEEMFGAMQSTLDDVRAEFNKKFEEKARNEKKVFSFGNTKVVAEKVEDEVIDLDNNETTSSEDVEIF